MAAEHSKTIPESNNAMGKTGDTSVCHKKKILLGSAIAGAGIWIPDRRTETKYCNTVHYEPSSKQY